MAFVAVSHWTSTEISDEMISTANEKCIPLIMRVGANGVQMVRTGELSLCVETLFPDASAAQTAQAKIAEIREQLAKDFSMIMVSAHGGAVIGRLFNYIKSNRNGGELTDYTGSSDDENRPHQS